MALGLVVVLGATVAFMAGKKLFTTDTEVQATQDSLRFARHIIQRVVRQAGYVDYAPDSLSDGVAVIAGNANSASIAGATNTVVNKTDGGFGNSDTDMVNRNDSLMVRFFGRSSADSTDTLVDCMGRTQSGPSANPSPNERAWSFFFVAVPFGSTEPELYCKTRTQAGTDFDSQPLVQGVERFKVLYGYDGDGDTVPEAWLDAKGVVGKAAANGNDVDAEWGKVVAVRVGMVLRSSRPNADLKQVKGHPYVLYPLGAEFSSVSFDPPDDGRFRTTASFTLMLRNVVRDSR